MLGDAPIRLASKVVQQQSLKEGAYGKLELPWVGPCRILQVKDNGINYVVKQLQGPVAGTFNVKNIKDFFTYYTPKPKTQPEAAKKPVGVSERPKDLRWLMDWGPATEEQARLRSRQMRRRQHQYPPSRDQCRRRAEELQRKWALTKIRKSSNLEGAEMVEVKRSWPQEQEDVQRTSTTM